MVVCDPVLWRDSAWHAPCDDRRVMSPTPTPLGHWSSAAHATVAELRSALDRRSFGRNVAAGVSTALVALPLNIALALACDLPASVGLWTGAIAGVVGGLLGGARLQITGPEVALAPISYAIVSEHGVEGLLWCTFLAGLVQIGLGLARLGRYVRAIPAPVIMGFMAAVGLMVLDAQLPRLMGLPEHVRGVWPALASGVPAGAGVAAVLLGGLCCALLVALPRLQPRLPAPLIAVGVAMLLVFALDLQVSHVPEIESLRPTFGLGGLSMTQLLELLPSALSLAALASLDSLLSAVSLDARMGTRHRGDQELVAQGIANSMCGLLGGMPVAGAIVRSAAAADAGGTDRVAPLAQSLVLGLVLLLLGAHLDLVPLAALAAVLCVVGVKLVQPKGLLALLRRSRADAAIAAITAVSILALDFVLGVALGVAASLARLALVQSRLRIEVEVAPSAVGDFAIYRVTGPLVFATCGRLEDALLEESRGAVVLDLTSVPFVDVTASAALGRVIDQLAQRDVDVDVAGTAPSVRSQLARGASVATARALAEAPGRVRPHLARG